MASVCKGVGVRATKTKDSTQGRQDRLGGGLQHGVSHARLDLDRSAPAAKLMPSSCQPLAPSTPSTLSFLPERLGHAQALPLLLLVLLQVTPHPRRQAPAHVSRGRQRGEGGAVKVPASMLCAGGTHASKPIALGGFRMHNALSRAGRHDACRKCGVHLFTQQARLPECMCTHKATSPLLLHQCFAESRPQLSKK